ncbi:MAG: enoyl-CoA hydratase/isomerase family protein [Chromatiaceae bacterium]|nr:enoyl-CoA hydratase/isomerase family protein [Chromatiaceae bacterium]
MSSDAMVQLTCDDRGIAHLTLNRPHLHNAFDDALIAQLLQALKQVEREPGVRAVVLAAAGKSFSAGADLNWMRRMAGYSREQNHQDALQLAALMEKLNHLNKPTIARVQGAAFGGGVGLVACCDIAVGAQRAQFALTEVRLGLIPAVISPYVIAAIGERAARRYMLTGERFDANEALRIGLLHQVVPEDQLDSTLESLLVQLLNGGPQALAAAKSLIFAVSRRPTSAALVAATAERITSIRASDEGREGVGAFLEKRSPNWIEPR